ncbi:ABC transporter ATP-binding protein/permease [Bacillus velezensis]|uniref:ABC transporter ATP-binding protein n=1 Tax=Bacillus TaxID=1386 RepID=UPI000D6CE42A|nr:MULTISPECIES: ABC transporter ATP-binding protein [Bacillus]MDK4202549.1 ABC transporter ATP-binding protein [Bacillus velezensis]PWK00010.1 ABC-type multidrug transport system fused ATPase/permease subunit [Bacillus sp. VMFN-A1]TRW36510.1 ABC transporter ATP-binding protein [Bacillus sp. PW192]UOF67515.1 ABC transporter ATP-binding protein/permease [Bacillus velezensis]
MNEKISKSIYKKNIGLFILSCLLGIMTSILFIALAIILQKFIDYSINKDIDNIIKVTTVSVILLPLGAVGMYVGYAVKNLYTKRATLNLKNTLVENILRLDMRSFNKESNGTYISRLSNDITIIQNDYIKGTVEIFVQLAMLVGGVLAMFIINSFLALSILLTCIIPLAVSSIFNNRMQKAQGKVAEQNKNYVSFIKDILSGNQVVKSFNIEKEIFERAKAKANKQEKAKMVYENLLSLIMSLTDISTFLVAVVIFIVGTQQLMKGEITVGEIMAFIQLLNCVTVPINRLITGFTKRQASRALLMNFNKIGEAKTDQTQRIDIPKFSNKISLNGLSLSVDGKKILDDINFEFEYGKSYAIVGTSGSGKTTLLKMLTGFYDGYEGNIRYDGVNLEKISDQSIFQNVSFIHQDCFIFDDTIEQNIKLFRECDTDEFEQVIKKSMLQKLIHDRGGFDVLCGENGIHFSGGEKQRISIARALLRKSPILLMDEATSALDNQTASDLECMLSEMQGITRISITHRLDESILSGYDEIVLLNNGKIEEHGTYHKLMEAKQRFYALSMLSSRHNNDLLIEKGITSLVF